MCPYTHNQPHLKPASATCCNISWVDIVKNHCLGPDDLLLVVQVPPLQLEKQVINIQACNGVGLQGKDTILSNGWINQMCSN